MNQDLGHVLAREFAAAAGTSRAAEDDVLIRDLAMLVRMLVRKVGGDSPAGTQALSFLQRKGLIGNPLRAERTAPAADAAPETWPAGSIRCVRCEGELGENMEHTCGCYDAAECDHEWTHDTLGLRLCVKCGKQEECAVKVTVDDAPRDAAPATPKEYDRNDLRTAFVIGSRWTSRQDDWPDPDDQTIDEILANEGLRAAQPPAERSEGAEADSRATSGESATTAGSVPPSQPRVSDEDGWRVSEEDLQEEHDWLMQTNATCVQRGVESLADFVSDLKDAKNKLRDERAARRAAEEERAALELAVGCIQVAEARVRDELASGICGPDDDTGPAARMHDVAHNLLATLREVREKLEGKT